MPEIEITKETLPQIIFDDEQRTALFELIRAEHGTDLPLSNAYAEAARTCQVTPQQLREIVHLLLRVKADDEFIEDFVFNDNAPDDILFELFDLEHCIVALSHTKGPQALLEQIAAKYRYSEAITTLALNYYGLDAANNQKFVDFITEYKDDAMMRYHILRRKTVSKEKLALALTVFEAQ